MIDFAIQRQVADVLFEETTNGYHPSFMILILLIF